MLLKHLNKVFQTLPQNEMQVIVVLVFHVACVLAVQIYSSWGLLKTKNIEHS